MTKWMILAVIAVFAVGCASTAGTSAGNPKDGAGNMNPATEDATSAAVAREVFIEAYKFFPETLTIEAGTKVTWINHDAADHQVHDDTEAWKSPVFGKEATFEQAFTAPGTYQYHCHVHPDMRGTIVVE